MVKADLVQIARWQCGKCYQHYTSADDANKCCSECPKWLEHNWDEFLTPWKCRNCGVTKQEKKSS